MNWIVRGAALGIALGWISGCSVSAVASRPDLQVSPLSLEVFSTAADVRLDQSVSLHVRVRNMSVTPIENVMLAVETNEQLQPMGAIGSSLVSIVSDKLRIERIAELGPDGIAEWWVVLRAQASGAAHARVVAVAGALEDASYGGMQWRVIADGLESATSARVADPAAQARTLLERAARHRAENQPRDEMFALYAARALLEQAPDAGVSDAQRADIVDRTRELYAREYGMSPQPQIQPQLPRTSVLTGYVVDRVSQAPIAAATVVLQSMFTDAVYATTETGSDGGFQFTHLDAELMALVVSTPGYQTATRVGFELRPDAITRLITELAPDTGAKNGLTGEVRDLAELHGIVSGYRGDGARDVQVILAGTDTLEALTDEQGRFRFTEIAPGDYTFVAVKPGFATIERRAVRVDPGGVIEVQFTLEPE